MRSEFKKAVSLLPEKPVIVEVGSAVGDGVNYMLKHRPKAEIYAIEASPENFANLRKNVPETVKCYNYAIGRHNKKVKFYTGEYLHNSFFKNLLNNVKKKAKITGCTLDKFIETHEINPDFIRFDCYGSEYDIFKGTLGFLDVNMILIALYKKKDVYEKYYKERRRVMNKRFKGHGFKLAVGTKLKKHIHQLWVKP